MAINLIRQMAKENLLWGAEGIRGELLKLKIKIATATIQKYIRLARPPRAPNQTWSVFLNHHARIVELTSRRIVHSKRGCFLQLSILKGA